MITGETIMLYKDQMSRIAYNILQDNILTEDAVSEAVEFAWIKRDQYDPSRGAAVNTWLCAIARNCALQIIKKGKRIQPIDDLALDKLTDVIEEDTYEEDQIKIKSDFEKAMFAIQKRFKRWPGLTEIFVEYYTKKNVNLSDIALMYNLPDCTLRTLFSRAKLEARAQITGIHYTQKKEKKKRIDMLTKQGQYIRTFDSAKKASEWLDKGTLGMIYIANVASGLTKRHSAYKYQWKWTDEN